MFKGIDLFSDTVTKPTVPMLQAMMAADLGDEQRQEDPTTRKLEEKIADMTGHSEALFFPSATMANEVALKALSEPGMELIGSENCHLFTAEAGGPAVHSQLLSKPIHTSTGIFSGEDVRKLYRGAVGPLNPVTGIVSVENTTNMDGGIAWKLEELDSVLKVSEELTIASHLDGARLFNAVVKSGLSPKAIAERFDTVTICLSKGLGCAMGAVLAFDRKLFPKVRRLKQLFGGALRQSGILAAGGLYALENHIHRLQEDHAHADLLRDGLEGTPHLFVEHAERTTNMVFFRWISKEIPSQKFYNACLEKGVRFSPAGTNRFRGVTHMQVSKSDIERAIKTVREVSKGF